ncbi:MAG: TIGR03915 family putative DNA repair protein [Clostridia bacterium]|nr:TIGR03915 family putative DNA repair protein [Clostridia bacterium]
MNRNIYCLDGERQSFFAAVFDAYNDQNAYLSSSANLQAELGDICIRVEENEEKTARVLKKLKTIDADAPFDIATILRNSAEDAPQTALEYIRETVKTGRSVKGKLSSPWVRRAMDLRGQVLSESHRLKGFLRFQETLNGVLYAACSPDHLVIDLLLPHFTVRLKGLAFVIHDVKRGLAAMYDGKSCVLVRAQNAELIVSDRESAFSSLWKKYYDTVNIGSRKNTRQQKNYMPVRYWKFLNENASGEKIDGENGE